MLSINCDLSQSVRLVPNGLEATAEVFHQLFLSSKIPMAILDSEGRFVSGNTALCDLLGYSDGELRGVRHEDMILSANRLDKMSLIKPLSDQASNHVFERVLIRKDRSGLAAKIGINRVDQGSLKPSLFLFAIEDLSEQKNRESALNRRKIELSALASQVIQSQENERKHLSRELHDDIGQRLSLAASEVALLASQHASAAPVSLDRLDSLREELDSLCSDVHHLSHNLHSYKLQHLGLKSALKDLCDRISQPNFRIELHADEFEEPVSKDVSLCLYRIAQESLNNALKHAHTSLVDVTITRLQNKIYMTVKDSGVGFDTSNSSHGLGLISMKERLKLVDGQVRIHSVPGHGTEIWVEVPDEQVRKDYRDGSKPSTHSYQRAVVSSGDRTRLWN